MSIVVDNNLLEQVHSHWINLQTREVWIHGIEGRDRLSPDDDEPGIEYQMSSRVIKNLHILRLQSKTKPVIIHMYTGGGSWEDGMALYDTIKLMPYDVTIISYTQASSMSSIVLQSGDERLLLPNSHFLFHQGQLYVGGEHQTVMSSVKFYEKTVDVMLDIYVEAILRGKGKKFKGQSPEKIRQYLKKEMEKKSDVILSATEAVEWGFADGILEDFS